MSDQSFFNGIVAGLPRGRPSAVLIDRIIPLNRIPNRSSLEEFSAGDRVDMLTHQGQDAIRNAAFGPSALALMEMRKLDHADVTFDLLNRMSVRMAHHLNHMPEQLELMIVAAKPAPSAKVAQQSGIYKRDRQYYVEWVGELMLESADQPAAIATGPANAPSFGPKAAPVGRTLTLGRDGWEKMRNRGLLPLEWSIEHIEPRGLDIGASKEDINNDKNRLNNLIVMPQSVNWWTAELKSMQVEVVFPKKDKTKQPEFIFCARPKQGPEHGFFIYGAANPVNITNSDLHDLQKCQIMDLPEVQDILARPKQGIASLEA